MSKVVLVCGCGQRMSAPGAVPGRFGRCPACGAQVRVPTVEPARAETEPAARGYALDPARDVGAGFREPPSDVPAPARRISRSKRVSASTAGSPAISTSGLRGSRVLYPARGAEALVLVAALGTAFWVCALLVPEYCLSVLRDANSLGTPTMGQLVALISALPAMMLFAPLLFYAVQYLGRVLVSSALGDARPPRPPDRNFDGFLNGLSPWLLWLAMGASVGFLPLASYWLTRSGVAAIDPRVALGLAMLGMPYALMALMMTFLHDDALAATPWAVAAALAKAGASFLAVCAAVAAALAAVGGAFAGALALRDNHFWLYLPVGLACWLLTFWVAIVVMHTLGAYYYRRRKRLRWHRKRPRWGVHWGL